MAAWRMCGEMLREGGRIRQPERGTEGSLGVDNSSKGGARAWGGHGRLSDRKDRRMGRKWCGLRARRALVVPLGAGTRFTGVCVAQRLYGLGALMVPLRRERRGWRAQDEGVELYLDAGHGEIGAPGILVARACLWWGTKTGRERGGEVAALTPWSVGWYMWG